MNCGDENLKAVILAGGRGTRLGKETTLRPKPMVEIGGMPILWHIMKIYSVHGITDFVIPDARHHFFKILFISARVSGLPFLLTKTELELVFFISLCLKLLKKKDYI